MKYYFIHLLVVFHLILVNCEEKADLDFVFSIDDGRSSIEVFKSKSNDLILNTAEPVGIDDVKKLKWYSMGKPIVIRTKSNKYENETFVHLQRDGFYLNVQILSEAHKKLIIEKINEKHENLVELYQIEEIPLNEFGCDFHVNHDDEESILKGVAKQLTTSPLKVHFTANEIEMVFLFNSFSKYPNELQLDCEYKSNIGGLDRNKKLIVKLEKQITVIEF
jgi:hypothetical protein